MSRMERRMEGEGQEVLGGQGKKVEGIGDERGGNPMSNRVNLNLQVKILIN